MVVEISKNWHKEVIKVLKNLVFLIAETLIWNTIINVALYLIDLNSNFNTRTTNKLVKMTNL